MNNGNKIRIELLDEAARFFPLKIESKKYNLEDMYACELEKLQEST